MLVKHGRVLGALQQAARRIAVRNFGTVPPSSHLHVAPRSTLCISYMQSDVNACACVELASSYHRSDVAS